MKILGIDPGKQGAFVLVENKRIVDFKVMPLIGKEINLPELLKLLVELTKTVSVCYLEDIQGFGLGSKSSFLSQGKTWGIIRGILFNIGIPTVTVMPKRWQATEHIGCSRSDTPKKRSFQAFQNTYGYGIENAYGKHNKQHIEGLVDAYLIACHGLKMEGK